VKNALKDKMDYPKILVMTDEKITSMAHDKEYVGKVRKLQMRIVDEWGNAVIKGKYKVKSYQDVYVALRPSKNIKYLMSPPVDGPEDSDQYFSWPCKIDQPYGSGFACWDTTYIMEGIIEAFIIYNIKEKHTEMLTGSNVIVVGRYDRNEEVTLLLGNIRSVPMLKDCYIFPYYGSNGYPIENIDNIISSQQ